LHFPLVVHAKAWTHEPRRYLATRRPTLSRHTRECGYPVRRELSLLSRTPRNTGSPAFAGDDDRKCGVLAFIRRTFAFSRREAPEFYKILRLEKQRAQGKPGARCTRSLVRKVESTRVSHHRFTGTPGLPCAMVLTGYFALSPVIGLVCHRRSRELLLENLTPASRRQDHTTSPSAFGAVVCSAISVHRIPPASVTIAIRPSTGSERDR
jgi:hypothetical protein